MEQEGGMSKLLSGTVYFELKLQDDVKPAKKHKYDCKILEIDFYCVLYKFKTIYKCLVH